MSALLSVTLEGCRFLGITVDLWLVIGVAAIVLLVRALMSRVGAFPFRNVEIDSVALGFGPSSINIRVDRREQKLAYALWVELGTRKAALPFDEEHDVIVEVYDSWYKFFGIARDLMRDMPPYPSKGHNSLAFVTESLLNKGMRPHLTKWQAVFRRWYGVALEDPANREKTPQEIQRDFPGHEDLVDDIKRTNKILVRYRDKLDEIVRMK